MSKPLQALWRTSPLVHGAFVMSAALWGKSIGCGTHWVLAATLTLVMPYLLDRFTPASIFPTFAVMMVLQLLFVLFMMPQRRFHRLFLSLCALVAFTARAGEENAWIPLLDKDLSKWEVYLSYAHTTLDVTGPPLDVDGQPLAPVGLNNDTRGVFTVIEEEGDLVLRVSGEIYGCLGSLEQFENYHLSLQVKWGEQKWAPRLDEPKDTGLLYHSIADYGVDYWLSWKLSQELQIMEDAFGDYWSIAGAKIDIRCEMTEEGTYRYDPTAAPVSDRGIGDYCQRSANHELPSGEWNTVELVALGDRSIHIVNGHVVMTLENSRYFDGDGWLPLTKGGLQIQSEAAEVYFKDIRIRPIEAVPADYAAYF